MLPTIFTFIALISIALGIALGIAILHFIKSPTRILKSITVSKILLALVWIGYLIGIIYWSVSVEPRLDGTEGTGVGFGAAFIYVINLIVALFITGLTLTIIFTKKHKH